MATPSESYDVVIIGAGIAGAALAYCLSRRGITKVLVLEREELPGHHATGRSAATLLELDPHPVVEWLKIAGGEQLRQLPADFSEHPVLDPQGALGLFSEDEWPAARQRCEALRRGGLDLELLTPADASARVDGILRPDCCAGAVLLPRSGFLDVHELLSSYLAQAKRRGVVLRCRSEVTGLELDGRRCSGVRTASGRIAARWVVNAAGAWVGQVARLAPGAAAIPFTLLRRSLVIFPAPAGCDPRGWPLVWSEAHRLYFRREVGGVMFCPMDEVPLEPCEPAVDELVIAAGLERLKLIAPRLFPRTLGRRWAGLRTFSPDRIPVVGRDPEVEGLFWLAGQGGCGIETSPLLGEVAADLLTAGRTERLDQDLLSPARFAS